MDPQGQYGTGRINLREAVAQVVTPLAHGPAYTQRVRRAERAGREVRQDSQQ